MTKRIAIAVFLAGCAGGTTEPVTITTSTADGAPLATHVGTISVPDDAYTPEGCAFEVTAPHPPSLQPDLDALTRASDCTSPETVVSVEIGHYAPHSFGASFEEDGRTNFHGSYRVAIDDEAGNAALADLIARIR